MNTPVAPAPDRLPLERRVRVRAEQGERQVETQPVSLYDGVHAWVLIGDPGAGKSDVFQERSHAEGGTCLSARDFVELGPGAGWHEPLFIDGLDEISSGAAPGDTALGRIRAKLHELGTPRFRISCREADWRGSADSAALQRLVGPQDFLELHLEPLSREEARTLVAFWRGTDAEQAEVFLRDAEQRGLDGLLDNPQNLRMLVKATASGWPGSRRQTYAQACAELVKEESPEHRAAQHEAPRPHTELLRAAEYLCAVLLLSGKASWALQRADNTPADSFALNDLPSQLPDTPAWASCRAVLGTRLFRGAGGLFYPVHRTVAEYLGARYLLERLQAGLPIGRLLALMLGEDGGTVPELRGLHAWLAAVASGDVRAELITHDPLGVVLYGDVRGFTRTEKRKVLEALGQEARRYTFFRSQDWTSEPFGALATVDMEEDFRALLTSPDRSPAHLALVDCVLDALAHGQAMPGLRPELEGVVRDASYGADSRAKALRVLVALQRESGDWQIARQLLRDINDNKVADTEDELLGTLLSALYPGQISPAELVRHFRPPKSEQLIGAYSWVWHELPSQAPSEDIPSLLDGLLETGFRVHDGYDSLGASHMIGPLLIRGLHEHGEHVETSRLYDWLSLGLGPDSDPRLEPSQRESVANWLADHPSIYKALFVHGLRRMSSGDAQMFHFWRLEEHLYRAPQPSDADTWYLSLAHDEQNAETRHHLLWMAFRHAQQRNVNAALELLESWHAAQPDDRSWIDDFLSCAWPPDETRQKLTESSRKRRQREAAEARERHQFFQENLPSLLTDTPHLGALREVANAYRRSLVSQESKHPLYELLDNNREWVELALQGLRHCLMLKDLPAVQAIIDLNLQGRHFTIAAACLAAMHLRHAQAPSTAFDLPADTLESVVAFYLTGHQDSRTEWFKQLPLARPELVTRVLLRLAGAQIAAKKELVDGLYALADDPEFQIVTRQVVPELLRQFPIRAHKSQLQSLRLLLISAFQFLDRQTVLDLVAAKLVGKPMDVAQHVYWLTLGFLLAPEHYLLAARSYLGATQARTSHLVALLMEQRRESPIRHTVPPLAALEFLVTLLGPRSAPRIFGGGASFSLVTPAMQLAEYMESLINTLAGLPGDDATQALTRLLTDAKLAPWADTLRRAAFNQQITRRKAHFQPADALKVCNTLANLKPASAADLWALTQDHLRQLIRRIRDENTNGYRQYWDAGNPRHEEECRDILLFALQPRLALLSVNAEPEGRYADDKRADIKVSAEGYSLPIEIKCEWNADLWKAIEAQLIAKYTRDPACDGFGIYLVFWFGGSRQKATPLDGSAGPKAPAELQQRLTATIPEGHRHKIAVLVIDCALKPPALA